MIVTVDQRVLALPEKSHNLEVAFDVQFGQTPEDRRHLGTELVERDLDEHRTASRDLQIVRLGPHPLGRAQPRQVAALISRVQLRKFFDGGVRHVQDVVVVRGGKPAAGCGQVFQHHHERPVLGPISAVPNTRHPHGQLTADVRVHTRLGYTQADLSD